MRLHTVLRESCTNYTSEEGSDALTGHGERLEMYATPVSNSFRNYRRLCSPLVGLKMQRNSADAKVAFCTENAGRS
jgi:hypothetical protein